MKKALFYISGLVCLLSFLYGAIVGSFAAMPLFALSLFATNKLY